jgi:phage baseplate assembly protein V
MTALSDPRRVIGNIVQFGTVESVDLPAATCRVRVGEIVTGDLPWLASRAGATRIWSPPTVGEQCVLLCPEGDFEAGVVLPGLFSDAARPPSTLGTINVVRYSDGAFVQYDTVAKQLSAVLPTGGKAVLRASGGVTITGPVTIAGRLTVQGDVSVTGTVTSSIDVVAAGKSLKGHKHLGVAAGAAVSGPPE